MSGSHTTRGCREKPPPELHSELLQLELQSSPQRPAWSCLKTLPHLPLQGSLLEQKQVPLSSGVITQAGQGSIPHLHLWRWKSVVLEVFALTKWAGGMSFSCLGHDEECDSQTSVQVNFVQGSVLTHVQRRYQGVGPAASWFLPHKYISGPEANYFSVCSMLTFRSEAIKPNKFKFHFNF